MPICCDVCGEMDLLSHHFGDSDLSEQAKFCPLCGKSIICSKCGKQLYFCDCEDDE